MGSRNPTLVHVQLVPNALRRGRDLLDAEHARAGLHRVPVIVEGRLRATAGVGEKRPASDALAGVNAAPALAGLDLFGRRGGHGGQGQD